MMEYIRNVSDYFAGLSHIDGYFLYIYFQSYVVSKVKGIDEVEANRLVRDYMLPEKGQLPGWVSIPSVHCNRTHQIIVCR